MDHTGERLLAGEGAPMPEDRERHSGMRSVQNLEAVINEGLRVALLEETPDQSLEVLLEHLDVDIGDGDGAANAIDHQDHQGEEDLFPQLGDTPRFAYCLDHPTSPPPSRQPPRSPPERTWRMRKLPP